MLKRNRPWLGSKTIFCPLFLLITLLFLLSAGSQALALASPLQATGSSPPILVVSGTGYANVYPDQAKVTLAVVTTDRLLIKAQKENNSSVASLTKALNGLGIPSSQIETSGYYVWPQYRYPESKEGIPPEIIGYQIRNEVTVTVTQLNKIGQILDAALKAGANEVQSVSYSCRDDTAAQQQSLTTACLKAKAKANTVAQALGLKLGEILDVRESNTYTEPYPVLRGLGGMAEAPFDPETQYQPGLIKIQSTVTITYTLLPGN